MAIVVLGDAERRFIIDGVQDDLRTDGRGCEEYRHIDLKVGVVANTHGSSRLRVGNTELIVGVKLDLSKPLLNLPEQGLVEFNIDCSPNATPVFQGRGGENLAASIKSLLTRAYGNNLSINLRDLCVVPGRNCWNVSVDVLILECGGNLVDAVSIAVFAALHDTSVPKLSVTEGDEGDVEISLPDDPLDGAQLDVSNCPVFVTLSKIGHRHVVDCTAEEEVCSLAFITLSIMRNGRSTALRKGGHGSLDPESVVEMIESGQKIGMSLHKHLRLFLQTADKVYINGRNCFL